MENKFDDYCGDEKKEGKEVEFLFHFKEEYPPMSLSSIDEIDISIGGCG